jgi:hypothetical protein
MSKKTIPFPTVVIPPSGARQSVADSRSATDAEDWVREKPDAHRAADLAMLRSAEDHPRGGVTFVLSDDASWLELLSFTFVLPYLATCYWINRTSQKAIGRLTG